MVTIFEKLIRLKLINSQVWNRRWHGMLISGGRGWKKYCKLTSDMGEQGEDAINV